MVDSALPLQYPVGSNNEALRSSIVRLVDVLRTLQTDSDQQTAIDAIEASVTNLTTTVNSNVADIGDVRVDVTDLEGSDTVINTTITNVLGAIGVVESDVAALQSNELTPQERFEIALDHAIDTVQGSRLEWQRHVEQQMMNIVDLALQVRRLTNDNGAAITVEQTVRVTENESFAQQVTALTADLANTDAAVVVEQTARADGDSALATDIATVTSTANGNTASVNTLTQSVDGINAQWGVSVNQNGRVTGVATLDSAQNVSSFAVLADKFIIVHPTNDNDTLTAFTSGLVNGVQTIGLTGAVIIDGSLLARHIAANQINATHIAAGQIDAAHIAAGSITTNHIAAGAITADQITTGVLQSTNGVTYINLDTGEWRSG